MTQSSTFPVSICTYNRHELLRQALNVLVERSIEKSDEVVIVNGGNDQADRFVKPFIVDNGLWI